VRFVAMLGPWLYPLGVLSVVLVADVVRAAVATAGRGTRAPHHTVLAWGVLAAAVGALGTVEGVGRLALGAREAAGGERMELDRLLDVVEGGAIVAATPATAGLGLLAFSLVAWIVLQYAFTRGG